MVKYTARKLDIEKSTPENIIYQYKHFLCNGNSANAREQLHQCLEKLFPGTDPILVDFRPIKQKSWRAYLRRVDIPETEYPISIEEYEEAYPLLKDSVRYVMAAFIQTVADDCGRDGFDVYRYFSSSSSDEAVKKAKRTFNIELDCNEGTLHSNTLRIKKVGRKEKWHLVSISS